MSMEQYAIHIAPRGGVVDLAVDDIEAKREAALKKRFEYSKSKGAIGLYQNEAHVTGLIFAKGADLLAGWAFETNTLDGVIAKPAKAKSRKKEDRDAAKALRDELAALPALPGAWQFTAAIKGRQCMTANPDGRGLVLLSCWYERVDGVTFVMTPLVTKEADETMGADECQESGRKTAFCPEGCERVPLSRYYLAKEAAAAKAKGGAS